MRGADEEDGFGQCWTAKHPKISNLYHAASSGRVVANTNACRKSTDFDIPRGDRTLLDTRMRVSCPSRVSSLPAGAEHLRWRS